MSAASLFHFMSITTLFRKTTDLETPKVAWKSLPVNNPIRLREAVVLRAKAHQLYVELLPFTVEDKKYNVLTWIVWKTAERLIQLEKKLMDQSPSLKNRVFEIGGIELEAGVDDEIYTSDERQKLELAVERYEKVVFGCRFAADCPELMTPLPNLQSPMLVAGVGPQSLAVSMKNRESGVELIQSLLKCKRTAGLISRVQIAMRCLVEFEKTLPLKNLRSPCKLKIQPGEEYLIQMPQHVAAKVQALIEKVPVKCNYIPVHLEQYDVPTISL